MSTLSSSRPHVPRQLRLDDAHVDVGHEEEDGEFVLGWWERWTSHSTRPHISLAELRDQIEYESFRRLGHAFRSWRQNASVASRKTAIFHWSRSLMQKCFESWRGWMKMCAPNPIETPQQVATLFRWIATTLPRRYVYNSDHEAPFVGRNRLRMYVAERVIAVQRFQPYLRHSIGLLDAWICYEIYRTWSMLVLHRRRVNALAEAFSLRRTTKRLSSVLSAWAEHTKASIGKEEKMRMANALNVATAHSKRTLLRGAYAAWISWISLQRERNALSIARIQRTQQKRIMNVWSARKCVKIGLLKLRAAITAAFRKKAFQKWKMASIHASFSESRNLLRNTLREWAKYHYANLTYRKLVLMRCQRRCQQTIGQWYSKAAFRARSRRIVEYMNVRRMGRLFRIAFLTIAVHAKEEKRDRIVCRRLRRARVRRKLHTWRKSCLRKKFEFVKIDLAETYRYKTLARSSIRSWSHFAAHSKAAKLMVACVDKRVLRASFLS